VPVPEWRADRAIVTLAGIMDRFKRKENLAQQTLGLLEIACTPH
jgi:hypothetical protein